jgi:phage portal protein BeeE
MRVRRVKEGGYVYLEYRYTEVDGDEREIPEEEIWHLKAFSIDGVTGLSTIRHGANTFGSAMAADEAAARVFANGLSAGGALMTDKILKKEQRD